LIPRGAITIVAIFLALFILMVSLMYATIKEYEISAQKLGVTVNTLWIKLLFAVAAFLIFLAFIISFLVLMIEVRMFSHRF